MNFWFRTLVLKNYELTRPSLQCKFPSLSIFAVQDFLDRIQACSVCSVNIANVFILERDPKDAKYVDLAIATKADFLVTRDKDLLDLREKESLLVQIFEKLDWQH
ncbi:MAG: putative toxin-antitoxin system toxin component, PIN family [Planctomycetota bacterium]|nr:putative toxin-antitoxin system toxin component, PIN family [Planctomycetota bacterium]